jgi:hypothetical protein
LKLEIKTFSDAPTDAANCQLPQYSYHLINSVQKYY